MLALSLARIHLRQVATGEPSYEEHFNHLLRGAELLSATSAGTSSADELTQLLPEQRQRLTALLALPNFAKCIDALKQRGNEFNAWMASDKPEMEPLEVKVEYFNCLLIAFLLDLVIRYATDEGGHSDECTADHSCTAAGPLPRRRSSTRIGRLR